MIRILHRLQVLVAILCLVSTSHGASFYSKVDLVSDLPGHGKVDPNLINPWGLAFSPGGFARIADNGTGVSTSYNGRGSSEPPVVNLPGAGGGSAAPTGEVYNGTTGFVVGHGKNAAPAQFLFASEDGTISGWSPKVPPPAPSHQAQLVVDNSAEEAIYKGLALTTSPNNEFLYATDFHNNRIDVFNGGFHQVTPPGGFTDPNLPAGYAPFGIQNIHGLLYVSYALQDADAEDDVPGAGHGFVDVFNARGELLHRLISGGVLNSPWGMTLAPASFGKFGGDLLVGNFGNGRINAFDPNTGDFLGTLRDENGHPLQIDGLWGLAFGNGAHQQGTNELFFTAGLNDEADGLFGKIVVGNWSAQVASVPEPSTLFLAFTGLLAVLFVGKLRWWRV